MIATRIRALAGPALVLAATLARNPAAGVE